MFDALIVGGGPAGLSAALALGRCRRKVLLTDHGQPRNAASRALHGYLTRDGIDPQEFLSIGRQEVLRYPNVQFLPLETVSVQRRERHFKLLLSDGQAFTGRILLLATGIVDELPALSGIERFYGRSVHHCPFCDGWEHRDQILAVYGADPQAVELALKLRRWSHSIVLCPGGPSRFSEDQMQILTLNDIPVREGTVDRLHGEGDILEALVFSDGSQLACSALFFSPAQRLRSGLAFELGCETTESGQLACRENQETSIQGVFAIGNASPGLQLVIMAAADGTRAGFAIDEALHEADLEERQREV